MGRKSSLFFSPGLLKHEDIDLGCAYDYKDVTSLNILDILTGNVFHAIAGQYVALSTPTLP